MYIIYGIPRLRIKSPTAVAVGTFDGVHRGHKEVIRRLKRRAEAIKGKSCVLTFARHPLRTLRPRKTPPMLISARHRLNLLAAEGIDIAVLIDFTARFADMGPVRFAKDVLAGKLNAKEILAGEKFLFGRGRKGDAALLRELGLKFGFKARVVPPLKTGGVSISSTLIRKLVMSGRLKEAKRMLGRDVAILGTVTKGAGRGRGLGFPTANLDLHHEAIPPSGVYAVKVKMGNKTYKGVLNIGFRPTFEEARKEPVVEVYIFGFNKSIYGEDLEVLFVKKIRRERAFKDKSRLALRIEKDIRAAGGGASERASVKKARPGRQGARSGGAI